MSQFDATIKAASVANTLQNATPSTFEGNNSSEDVEDELSGRMIAEVLFISWFNVNSHKPFIRITVKNKLRINPKG